MIASAQTHEGAYSDSHERFVTLLRRHRNSFGGTEEDSLPLCAVGTIVFLGRSEWDRVICTLVFSVRNLSSIGNVKRCWRRESSPERVPLVLQAINSKRNRHRHMDILLANVLVCTRIVFHGTKIIRAVVSLQRRSSWTWKLRIGGPRASELLALSVLREGRTS
jgi:hypothetical protein